MPESFPYDRSSKWLIQHHGDSILRLGGIQEPFTWRALQPEVVQPRKLPDGLIEVTFAGESEADLFVLEIATYPDAQLFEQILRDCTLVFSDRRVLPEVVALVLCPKGGSVSRIESIGEAAVAGLGGERIGGWWNCGRFRLRAFSQPMRWA